ncbi:sodium:solute symporter [candidate division KSB1 bacterium]|nr:sodium:solute symporter [candidate division KSB1 bacterium]
MNIHPLDLAIIFLYLTIVTWAGIRLSGRLTSSRDYFLGGRTLPWRAVCLSVVATETSTLTFISIPGLAYLTNLNFLQLALGYIIGRVVVSFVFLPAYFRGDLTTSYTLLHNRFGPQVRRFSSLIFLFTRLLADGVRLFATAIPLSILTGWSIMLCIIIIAAVTMIYTSLGGLRSVVWIDVFQTIIYVAGAILTGFFILSRLPHGWQSVLQAVAAENKLQIFYPGFENSFMDFIQINYTLMASLLGGAFLSMASHGTDQIIVQRLLACRSIRESQKALITSGFIVLLQFAIFLLLGLLLYTFYNGVAMRSDEILPRFIIEELPRGFSGFIIAAVFAAAMSTLSSSLNSLASSTMFDLFLPHKKLTPQKELRLSRLFTMMWGIIFIAGAMFFKNTENPVVELGLAISSFTYGSVLGAFFLAAGKKDFQEQTILVSMWATILVMIWIIGPGPAVQLVLLSITAISGAWIFLLVSRFFRVLLLCLTALTIPLFVLCPSPQMAWPWYVPVGTAVMLFLGNFAGRLIKTG